MKKKNILEIKMKFKKVKRIQRKKIINIKDRQIRLNTQ